jgi:hypothetical protein
VDDVKFKASNVIKNVGVYERSLNEHSHSCTKTKVETDNAWWTSNVVNNESWIITHIKFLNSEDQTINTIMSNARVFVGNQLCGQLPHNMGPVDFSWNTI